MGMAVAADGVPEFREVSESMTPHTGQAYGAPHAFPPALRFTERAETPLTAAWSRHVSGKVPTEDCSPIRFRACEAAKRHLVKEGKGRAVLRLHGRQKPPAPIPRCEMASTRQEVRSHA